MESYSTVARLVYDPIVNKSYRLILNSHAGENPTAALQSEHPLRPFCEARRECSGSCGKIPWSAKPAGAWPLQVTIAPQTRATPMGGDGIAFLHTGSGKLFTSNAIGAPDLAGTGGRGRPAIDRRRHQQRTRRAAAAGGRRCSRVCCRARNARSGIAREGFGMISGYRRMRAGCADSLGTGALRHACMRCAVFAVSTASCPSAMQRTGDQELKAAILQMVSGTCCFYWKKVLCLQRAIVTARVLRRYGFDAEVVIGCRNAPFTGHAWVEIAGAVVKIRQDISKSSAFWTVSSGVHANEKPFRKGEMLCTRNRS